MALKRQGAQKQAENAAATHAAIEAQKDLLDGQELARDRERAGRLGRDDPSKTKGLLTKTETAVDSMEEMRDAFEEVGRCSAACRRARTSTTTSLPPARPDDRA